MVVLTLKNLQQQTFTVEIELSATVRALKEKVEKEKGTDYPAIGQKLIYAGKILQDDTTLDSYNIDDKKFLVIMVTKPKAAPPPPGPTDPTVIDEPMEASTQESTEPSSSSVTTPSTEASSVAASTTTSTSTTTTTTSTTTQPTAASNTQSTTATQPSTGGSVGSAESLLVMGEEFNRMVENIMEMGYERLQVERALRASFNNPYTAVQYLVDGIPPNLDEPAANPAGSGEGEEQVAAEGEPDPDEDPLNFLRSQPQFEQMRQMIRSNPSLLDAFIQQIGQTNPQLLQVIQQNQQAFVRMLNEGGSSGGTGGSTGGSGGTQSSGGGTSGGSGSGRAVPGQNAILVSPQDRDAIERLKALGNFPEDVVIQAYFACEKNENLAAEFLFSQTWD
ncbi:UV excision repair protein RAD23 homolog B-like isoform X1 [Homarus americanus]|uniref:UV excision repair protein RAD23 B-like n=1 Tax=Homarus americanus TaxID=6706 RepID=A0A8J5JL12_HOMAM|nr:UV excision repair protein RAD23 homolog B-like isoform X1 [Homarus americanus]KAG7157976.1 UV excision repair protein RAD23 B-like [Homarus americanus]